jgi:hypothetical protein
VALPPLLIGIGITNRNIAWFSYSDGALISLMRFVMTYVRVPAHRRLGV